MTIIPKPSIPTHDIGHARFTSLATPSRGSQETSLWIVEMNPHTPATPHSVTREEIFVVLNGIASIQLNDALHIANEGDTIVVPPHTRFEISNQTSRPLKMLCCLPVGGQAITSDRQFTPPWAE